MTELVRASGVASEVRVKKVMTFLHKICYAHGPMGWVFKNERDFGNLEIEDFYDSLKKSVELVLPYLKKHGYIIIFVKDLQPIEKETNLLHAKIVEKINEIKNINYKGVKIWADRSAKLFPYGYPFSFVANQIHQYIMIFRKEK